MSLTREVRLLSGVSALRVATDPSTLMSTVVHRGSLLHTDRALSQLGLTPVLELEHCIRQAPLDQEAPTKASRSLSHGKSSPEKRPSPRVTRPEKATASLGCVQSRASTRFLRDDWPTHFRNRLPAGGLPVVKLRAMSQVQHEVQRINSASVARMRMRMTALRVRSFKFRCATCTYTSPAIDRSTLLAPSRALAFRLLCFERRTNGAGLVETRNQCFATSIEAMFAVFPCLAYGIAVAPGLRSSVVSSSTNRCASAVMAATVFIDVRAALPLLPQCTSANVELTCTEPPHAHLAPCPAG